MPDRSVPDQYLRKRHPETFDSPHQSVFVAQTDTAADGSPILKKLTVRDPTPLVRLITAPHRTSPICFREDGTSAVPLRYDAETGKYSRITLSAVQSALREVLLELATTMESNGAHAMYGTLVRSIAASTHRLRAWADLAATDARVPGEEFDDPAYINVANGRVARVGLNFEGHNPAHYKTRGIELEWPSASDCPQEFLKMLEELVAYPEDVELLLDAMSVALVGNPTHTILLLTDDAGSGKSTLTKILAGVLGLDQVMEFRLMTDLRFEAGYWRDKSLLVINEVTQGGFEKKADDLKSVSGQDLTVAEVKGEKRPEMFTPSALVLGMTNSTVRIPVKTKADEDSWLRRLVVIPTKARPGRKVIPNYADRILGEEGPAILRLLLERAQKFCVDGVATHRLTLRQKDQITQMFQSAPSIEGWVRRNLRPDPGSAHLLKRDVLGRLKEWLKENQIGGYSDRELQSCLRDYVESIHGVRQSNSIPGGRGWRRLAWASESRPAVAPREPEGP